MASKGESTAGESEGAVEGFPIAATEGGLAEGGVVAGAGACDARS
jgi:hypothetical protein